MIKDSIREDIKIINIYAPNIRAPQSIMQMLIAIKREIDSNTITVGTWTLLTLTDEPVHRPSRQKINKETQALNYTLYQIDLVGIYRTFHQKKKKKAKNRIYILQAYTEHFPG